MDEKEARRCRRILLAVLLLSLLLRVCLVFSGGQYFFPDEARYEKSRAAAEALWGGDIPGCLRALHSADHFLFKVLGVAPAILQIIVTPSSKIPALYFSLFSVANLWLLWGIMRRAGENERAAFFAVGLLALCTTFLYYSRHLLPYDTAMFFGLLSLFVGQKAPVRAIDSIMCGLFSVCAFLTYNGYWLLAGFGLLAHVLRPPLTFDQCLRRAFISGSSFAVPLVILLAGSAALASVGGNLLQQFLNFSRTVTQGSYAEGWSLPFGFLWHSEHFLILLWGVALIYCVREFAAGRRNEAMILGLSGVLCIYGALVIFSVILEEFVVYGRLARQLVPFCSILTALFLERLWTSNPKGRGLAMIIVVMAVFQAAVNFQQPFAQSFPVEFRRLAAEASVPTKTGQYELLYDYYIYPEPLPVKEGGTIIIQERHPLQFLPYQYEGHTPDQRCKLRTNDIRMRLVLRAKQ